MGQRLIVNITKGNEIIANAYFHWHAYTMRALAYGIKLLEEIEHLDELEVQEDKQELEKAIETRQKELQEKPKDLIDAISKSIEFKANNDVLKYKELIKKGTDKYKAVALLNTIDASVFDNDRNEGLIAITKEGIRDFMSWTEGALYIDIDTKKLIFDCWRKERIRDYETNVDHIGRDIDNEYLLSICPKDKIEQEYRTSIDSNGEDVKVYYDSPWPWFKSLSKDEQDKILINKLEPEVEKMLCFDKSIGLPMNLEELKELQNFLVENKKSTFVARDLHRFMVITPIC